MKVSYLTDTQCREAYLLLLTRIDSYLWEYGAVTKEDVQEFWSALGYEADETPEY